ncbi:EthD domain-containing protein [Actinomadura sp. 9N407]|uniref:EthD domain-containing protein n=1 Tax=Actinomadura sp. 9N407 TaxID=3375154 RepID=UPI0037B5CC76
MIKRIRFATRRPDAAEAFPAAWPHAVAAALDAPAGTRPSRVAVCTTLTDLTGPDPRHDGIGLEWFTDSGHLRRFQEWLDGAGRPLGRHLDGILVPDASPVLVAAESVQRGTDWLDRRWRDGGAALKHMAIAVRADGLTPAEFSTRWRDHAGRVRRPGAANATVIPESARGRAYVQNHPCPRATGEWAYDALNEVYFDDEEGLRARIDWFRENLSGRADGDLFGRSWLIAAREEVMPAGT